MISELIYHYTCPNYYVCNVFFLSPEKLEPDGSGKPVNSWEDDIHIPSHVQYIPVYNVHASMITHVQCGADTN